MSALVDEHNIREVLGVSNTNRAVDETIYSGGGYIHLEERDQNIVITTSSIQYAPSLNVDEARRLARQLYRLARRVEVRNA